MIAPASRLGECIQHGSPAGGIRTHAVTGAARSVGRQVLAVRRTSATRRLEMFHVGMSQTARFGAKVRPKLAKLGARAPYKEKAA